MVISSLFWKRSAYTLLRAGIIIHYKPAINTCEKNKKRESKSGLHIYSQLQHVLQDVMYVWEVEPYINGIIYIFIGDYGINWFVYKWF